MFSHDPPLLPVQHESRCEMLHRLEGSGGKYPLIRIQIKTQRSSLMKAPGRAIIRSNGKGSHKHPAHQVTLLNNIKTQTTFKIHI